MKNPEALKALKRALGEVVITDEKICYKYSFDGLKISFMPEAVIQVKEEGQVEIALKLANKYKVAVTTRGAGSSLIGGATPVKGGWVLDVTRLNGIRIDAFACYAFVDAGVITGTIHQMAEEQGLFYPPDPSSSAFCTVGGNIACNAGGLRGAKYGVTRDYVVALRGFLPTGEKVSWGLPLKKYVSGYNIKDLWIGSEGTLGVITHAVLRLIKKPEVQWTCLADFGNEGEALKAVKALLELGVIPAAFEFLDNLSVRGAEKVVGQTFEATSGGSFLLIELDGRKAQVKEDRQLVIQWAKKYARNVLQTENRSDAEALWKVRKECSAAMFEHGNTKLNEDIVVPLSKLEDLVHFVKALSEHKHIKIPTFGHVADGNFHVNIMYNRENSAMVKRAEEALGELMLKVVELGGAITGEHGIGLAKTTFLKLQHTKKEIATMKAIKNVLDPNNILNPGKIFEKFHPWEYQTVKDKFPWDRY